MGGPKAADLGHGAGGGALRCAYEQLRQAVLSGDAGGWRLGHGVLVTRGMAAWMAAWTAPEDAPVCETAAPVLSLDPFSIPRPPQAPSSRLGANPIVTVLAQMALAHA
jgi:hypothetical protein